jgi:glycosyltransferase involved in cell wall biosynthesis
MSELVSVVIPVHRPEKAEKCVAYLKNQTYPHIEIIQVAFKGFPAAKRNFGYKNSHGSLILFLDEDEYLSPTTIAACVEKFREGYDLVGFCLKTFEQNKWVDKCCALYQAETFGVLHRFYRRTVLGRIGLFDETLVLSDELDLYYRALKARVKCGDIAYEAGHALHDFNASLHERMRKMLWGRRAYREMVKKNNLDVRTVTLKNRKRILREMVKAPQFIFGVVFVGCLCFVLRRLP